MRLAAGLASALILIGLIVLAARLESAALAALVPGLRGYALSHPAAAAVIFSAVYVAVAALAVPGVWAMSVAGGVLFGPWIGAPLAIVSSVAGATVAMLLARYALRSGAARRFPDFVRRLDDAPPATGAAMLLAARLAPFVPFSLVNAAAGMSRMPVPTFALVSAAGVAPLSIAYASAGAAIGAVDGAAHILSPGLVAVVALLGAAPLAARVGAVGLRRRRGRRN